MKHIRSVIKRFTSKGSRFFEGDKIIVIPNEARIIHFYEQDETVEMITHDFKDESELEKFRSEIYTKRIDSFN